MTSINRRLMPLFFSDFFAGLMFWWPILLPFLHHSGITTLQIGIYSILANIVILVIEVPSGILADRWSRKRVALIGLLSMAIGSGLLGIAHNFGGFILGVAFTGAYFAMRSGLQEAMIYDTLLESNQRQNYEYYVAKLRTINTVGVVLSSLLGAVLASSISFSTPFFITIISCAISFIFLLRFKEPQLHKQAEITNLFRHIRILFLSLGQHKEMQLLVFTSLLIGIEFCFMTQLDQLWPIALGLSILWYGPLNAFLMSSQGFAATLASRVAKNTNFVKLIGCALIVGALGLVIHNIFSVAISEFMLLAAVTILKIVLSGRIQDQLPSSQRSSVESAISTFSTLAFILVTVIFSAIAETHSIFVAAWIVVGIAVVALISLWKSTKATNSLSKS